MNKITNTDNIGNLNFRFKQTPEQLALLNKRIEAEKQRKLEVQELNKQQRINDYISNVPDRFKNSSFENFIPRKNGDLLKEKKQIEKLTGGIIYGTNGNGKTHLGYAACRDIVENGGSAKVIRAYNFFNEVKDSYGDNKITITSIIKKYASLDYLVIDEIEKIRGSKDESINLIELINRRYDKLKPTLIISNLNSLEELEELLTKSCTDKLKEFEVVEMFYDTTRTKAIQNRLKEKKGEI